MAYLFLVRQYHAHPQIEAFTKDIMPDITIKQIDELEQYTGPFQKAQNFFFGGKSLNLSKISMNAIKVPPHWCTERRECARQRIKGMKPAKRRKDKLIRLDDFDSETGREGRAPPYSSVLLRQQKQRNPIKEK